MWKHVSVIFIIVGLHAVQAQNLKVSVFYESLCPDCIKFITQQLFPTYKTVGNEIELDLIPFGKARVVNETGKLEFTCQHGPDECYGNEIHSCAIALYSVEEGAEFVYCSMNSNDPSLNANLIECANQTGIPWRSLDVCYKSGQGDKLLALNGRRTGDLQPTLRFVPTIVFNDSFNQTLQDKALTDLQDVVCELLLYEPISCRQYLDNDITVQLI